MAELKNLEARIERLERIIAARDDIESIRELKYKYFRCLDTKRWNELAECFTEDAVTSYSDGKYQFQGVSAIIEFLSGALGQTQITFHHGHHPEIELTSETTARGTWALEDYLVDCKRNRGERAAAFYQDEYAKVNGKWKIKSTGYRHVFQERWDRGESKSLKLTANMHASSEKQG